MTYKIANGLVHLSFNDFFSFYKSPYNTRRHPLCLDAKLCQKEAPKKTFCNRVVSVWNALPSDIVTSATLSFFRHKLNAFDIPSITELVYK